MSEPNENDPPRNRPWDQGGRDPDDRDDRDDRPRRRRRRDREDDEYDPDRPRRSGPPAKSGSSAGLVVIIVVVVGGLLLCVVGGLFFAVSKVRTAAARMSDQNNMRQIGLGMHNVNDRKQNMSQYARDDFDKVQTGLSFRVELLPYMEQASLYRQFDMREPWNGPTNRGPSSTMVKPYITPFDQGSTTVNTPYRVFYGGGALFEEDGKGVSLWNIPDGTSNTIMLVHATEQVPWAEPRKLRYDPNGPLPKFGHPSMNGSYNVLLADSSVRVITDNVSENTLRAAITKNGNERLPADW